MNIAILGAGNGGQAMAAHFAMLGNRELATQLAPWPEDGQVIVLNPGRTLGAFEFSGILRDPSRRRFYIAEAQSLLYTFRFEQPGKVRITAVIFPPPIVILNTATIERGDVFYFNNNMITGSGRVS